MKYTTSENAEVSKSEESLTLAGAAAAVGKGFAAAFGALIGGIASYVLAFFVLALIMFAVIKTTEKIEEVSFQKRLKLVQKLKEKIPKATWDKFVKDLEQLLKERYKMYADFEKEVDAKCKELVKSSKGILLDYQVLGNERWRKSISDSDQKKVLKKIAVEIVSAIYNDGNAVTQVTSEKGTYSELEIDFSVNQDYYNAIDDSEDPKEREMAKAFYDIVSDLKSFVNSFPNLVKNNKYKSKYISELRAQGFDYDIDAGSVYFFGDLVVVHDVKAVKDMIAPIAKCIKPELDEILKANK